MLFFLTLLVLHFGVHSTILHDFFQADFDESMSHSKLYKQHFADGDPAWQLVKRLYQTNIKKKFSFKRTPRIPQTFHLIWLGSPVPERYHRLTKQLRALHPDCTIKLWTDKEADTFRFINRAAYDFEENFGAKSDILRYEILYAEGGVYLDGDFELLKPFTPFLYATECFAGLAYNRIVELYNGLIGCSPGHPIMRMCIENCISSGSKHDVNAIMLRTGTYHFTRCFMEYAAQHPSQRLLPLPVAFFYPEPSDSYLRVCRLKRNQHPGIEPYSCCTHLWAKSWVRS